MSTDKPVEESAPQPAPQPVTKPHVDSTNQPRPRIRFIYENWAVIAMGTVLLGLAVAIQVSMSNPGIRLRIYLMWGILLLAFVILLRPILGILARLHLEGASVRQPSQSDTQLYLEDWKMTKDRIKHFDDMVIRIRTQGVPVATAILAAAFIASPTLVSIKVNLSFIKVTSLSLVFGASALLIIAIGFLDLLHYNLLLLAVKHAIFLENLPEFTGRLQITHKLTSPLLTFAHSTAAAAIYVSVAGAALYLAFVFR